ncbi:recombinase family protein [Pedobacter sp. AK013]|uniref:recombinase family protein n=1 Tax=Pedobacter sp. AK013 TaxID=2723071 RepID=UPI00161E25EC|nr:recombinase family protein [Pedobacter sp. AK013]
MKIADLYIRVSTDEQAEKGYSQRDQEERLKRYCEFNDIKVRKIIHEDHSAKTFNRPAWEILLSDLKKTKGKFSDLILFTKWDRFSRNAGDAYQMISILRRLGIEPQAIEQPLDLSIPENKLMLAIYLSTPEVENDRRALNVINGMRKARKEGRWMASAPVGYKNITTEDGKKMIVPREPEATLMKNGFETISLGIHSTEQVWKALRVEGLKCCKNNFLVAMRNPVYCGKIFIPKYKDEQSALVPGIHQGLVSEQLFYKVQDIMDGRSKHGPKGAKISSTDQLPLRGFLLCSRCTRILTGSASKGRGRYYSYYHCSSACGCRYKADIVNKAIVNRLKDFIPKPGTDEVCLLVVNEMYQNDFSELGESRKELVEKIDALNIKVRNARELLLKRDFDSNDYRIIKTECEEEIVDLEKKLFEISAPKVNIDLELKKAAKVLVNLCSFYQGAETPLKRTIIGSIFPEKLSFNGKEHRTARLNNLVSLISHISSELPDKKKWTNDVKTCLPTWVGPPGLEPGTKRL